jgi:type II secretory pathway pseudopilin PulG
VPRAEASAPATAAKARRSRGFTFLGLMFLIAVMALMATAAASTWAFTSQRQKELDLLFVGHEYRVALTRYVLAHAGQPQPYPTELRDLLGGKDQLVPVRYLRHLYFDPMTGGAEWGLVKTPQGGITGIYSLSTREPVRRRPAFGDDGLDFKNARSYRDWVFRAAAAAPLAPASANSPAAPGGWNETLNGAPPLSWENPPPTPPNGPVDND